MDSAISDKYGGPPDATDNADQEKRCNQLESAPMNVFLTEDEEGAVSVAGWYRKFPRNFSQTSWRSPDGDPERKAIFSVEEAIGIPLMKLFSARKYKFIAAGREDFDVRMLGGRPFLLELSGVPSRFLTNTSVKQLYEMQNSKYSAEKDESGGLNFFWEGVESLPMLRSMEVTKSDRRSFLKLLKEINGEKALTEFDSLVNVEVLNWKLLEKSKKAYLALAEGADEKSKMYECLVRTSTKYSEKELSDLEMKMSKILPFETVQETPVRVLHRRNLAERRKRISSLKFHFLQGNLFVLSIEAQGGTYIKEFISGDFGRTRPSLRDLMQCSSCECLLLDVSHIVFANKDSPTVEQEELDSFKSEDRKRFKSDV